MYLDSDCGKKEIDEVCVFEVSKDVLFVEWRISSGFHDFVKLNTVKSVIPWWTEREKVGRESSFMFVRLSPECLVLHNKCYCKSNNRTFQHRRLYHDMSWKCQISDSDCIDEYEVLMSDIYCCFRGGFVVVKVHFH